MNSILSWIIGFTVVSLTGPGALRAIGRKEITGEEFERGATRPSLPRTGLQEFQGFLEPGEKTALQAVQEEKRKSKQSIPGEPPAPVR
jgi:hypothetical protein